MPTAKLLLWRALGWGSELLGAALPFRQMASCSGRHAGDSGLARTTPSLRQAAISVTSAVTAASGRATPSGRRHRHSAVQINAHCAYTEPTVRPRAKFWVYAIAGDIIVAGVSPAQPWPFYLVTGLIVAAVAMALAGYY